MKNQLKRLAKLMLVSAICLMMTVKATEATPSTIVWIPSVDFQGFNSWHFGIDNYIRAQKETSGVRGSGIYDAGLTVGILPFKKFQAEIGIDYLSMGDAIYDAQPVYFNAKMGMPEGAMFKGAPGIAVGAYNFGLKSDLTNYNMTYGIISKTVPFIGRLSLGYYTGNDKLLLDGSGAKSNSGVLASWDRPMKEISDKLWFAVDYQGGKNYLGSFNFGFSWAFTDKIAVIVGYDIYNDKNSMYNSTNKNMNSFTTQLDINF